MTNNTAPAPAPLCSICQTATATLEYDPETGRDSYWSTCRPCWGLVPFAPFCGCTAQSTHMTPVVSAPGVLVRYECATCGSPKPQSLGPWHFTPATGWIPRRDEGESDERWEWRDGYSRAAQRRLEAQLDAERSR